jgi:hypothetical protein
MIDEFNNFTIPRFVPPEKRRLFETQTIILGNCLNGSYWSVADVLTARNFTNWGELYNYPAIYEAFQACNGGDFIQVCQWLRDNKKFDDPSFITRLSTVLSGLEVTQSMALKLIEIQLEEILLAEIVKVTHTSGLSNTILGACADLLAEINLGAADVVQLVSYLPQYLDSLGATSIALEGLNKVSIQFAARAKKIRQRSASVKVLADMKQFIYSNNELKFDDLVRAKKYIDCIEDIFLGYHKKTIASATVISSAKGEVVYE